MRDFFVRIACIISLVGMLLSLFYCQYAIIDLKYNYLKRGDAVLVDPHHAFGIVVSIKKEGKVGVVYTNTLGVSKYIIVSENRLHKVIIVHDNSH